MAQAERKQDDTAKSEARKAHAKLVRFARLQMFQRLWTWWLLLTLVAASLAAPSAAELPRKIKLRFMLELQLRALFGNGFPLMSTKRLHL